MDIAIYNDSYAGIAAAVRNGLTAGGYRDIIGISIGLNRNGIESNSGGRNG